MKTKIQLLALGCGVLLGGVAVADMTLPPETLKVPDTNDRVWVVWLMRMGVARSCD